MKKILRVLAVCLILVTLACTFSACTMQGSKTSTPAYVNTYYVNGTKDSKNNVTISTDRYRIMENNIPKEGLFVLDGNVINFYDYNGNAVIELKATLTDNVWTVNYKGQDYVKEVVSSQGCQSGNWSTYVIFGVLIAAIIGLFIWSSVSNKKKQKQAAETMKGLKIGDRVKTIGGICGFVTEIDDMENTFVLEVKSSTGSSFVKFDKGAIYQTAPASGNGSEVKAEPAPVAEEPKAEEKSEPAEPTEPAKPAKRKKKSEEDL